MSRQLETASQYNPQLFLEAKKNPQGFWEATRFDPRLAVKTAFLYAMMDPNNHEIVPKNLRKEYGGKDMSPIERGMWLLCEHAQEGTLRQVAPPRSTPAQRNEIVSHSQAARDLSAMSDQLSRSLFSLSERKPSASTLPKSGSPVEQQPAANPKDIASDLNLDSSAFTPGKRVVLKDMRGMEMIEIQEVFAPTPQLFSESDLEFSDVAYADMAAPVEYQDMSNSRLHRVVLPAAATAAGVLLLIDPLKITINREIAKGSRHTSPTQIDAMNRALHAACAEAVRAETLATLAVGATSRTIARLTRGATPDKKTIDDIKARVEREIAADPRRRAMKAHALTLFEYAWKGIPPTLYDYDTTQRQRNTDNALPIGVYMTSAIAYSQFDYGLTAVIKDKNAPGAQGNIKPNVLGKQARDLFTRK